MKINPSAVYLVTDRQAVIRSAPPGCKSLGKVIPWGAAVQVLRRMNVKRKTYVEVTEAYGKQRSYGWTVESNLGRGDVPTAERFGCEKVRGMVCKHGEYLLPEVIAALEKLPNPIRIKTRSGGVKEYYLRLTDCMYPATFVHKSKGHYSGHCVDIAFADAAGNWAAYDATPRKVLETEAAKVFNSIFKHDDHLHAAVAYPSWVNSRSTEELKALVRARKGEF